MMMYVVGVFRLLRDKQKRHLELFSLKNVWLVAAVLLLT